MPGAAVVHLAFAMHRRASMRTVTPDFRWGDSLIGADAFLNVIVLPVRVEERNIDERVAVKFNGAPPVGVLGDPVVEAGDHRGLHRQ